MVAVFHCHRMRPLNFLVGRHTIVYIPRLGFDSHQGDTLRCLFWQKARQREFAGIRILASRNLCARNENKAVIVEKYSEPL